MLHLTSGGFDWQWDNALNLDSSYFMEGFGMLEHDFQTVGATWLPMRTPLPELNQARPEALPPSSIDRNQAPQDEPMAESSRTSQAAGQSSASCVDENSRDMLAMSLLQRVPETMLPSTTFLNRCIYLYTTRIWPLLPVVHLPTFTPARTHPLLLLTICAVGALADGGEIAHNHAVRMFEGVRKAILVSFTVESAGKEAAFSVFQAGVIGQTCAILSGRPEHLRTARCFHGAMCVLAQEFRGVLHRENSWRSSEPYDTSGHSVSPANWHQWIREQTLARLFNALQIHNGELAAIVHQPAMIRMHASQIVAADSDTVFLAKSAEEWSKLKENLRCMPERPTAVFSSCAELEQVVSEIGHGRFLCQGSDPIHNRLELETTLVNWLDRQHDAISMERAHRLSPMILWHSCFLLLTCDLDTMENACKAIRKDGVITQHLHASPGSVASLREWAQSRDALTAVAHAVLITKNAERFRVSEAPALHVARCIWHAGLVLTAYSLFVDDHDSSLCQGSRNMQDHHEIMSARRAGLVSELDSLTASQPIRRDQYRTLAFSLCTTLRHLGPWKSGGWFAKKLSDILEATEMN